MRILILGFLLISSVRSFGQLSEKHYRIYSVKLNKEVTLADIAAEMNRYDVLFFGEEHNDSVAHYLQHKMLETLHQSFSNRVTLSMEMFDRDVQTVMNEYLKGDIREKNFTKDARVWSNYKDYRPLIEFAKNNKLDIICANAPSRYTNLAGRKGQEALMGLSDDSKKNFAPLPYRVADGKYYEKLMMMSSHHAPTATDSVSKTLHPKMAMGGFNLITAQSLWDATMAYSIAQYLKKHKGNKVLQVNGRFHSDEGFAIVTQLKLYEPSLRSLIISSGTDDSFPNIDWSKHAPLGDFIIITDPTVPRTYQE